MINLRFFPIQLYTFVFGAAGLGFSASQAMQEPTTRTLIAIIVFSTMTLAGYRFMRPFMAASRAAIKVAQDEKAAASAAVPEAAQALEGARDDAGV